MLLGRCTALLMQPGIRLLFASFPIPVSAFYSSSTHDTVRWDSFPASVLPVTVERSRRKYHNSQIDMCCPAVTAS